MAENNPMDFISKMLSNPDALSKVSTLFQQKIKEPEKEETFSVPEIPISSFNAPEDNSTRLLQALEPFLSSRRRGRIPQMMQVVQIGKMLGGMQKK